MRSTITFNGKSSADFGLIVEYYPESVHAPRRGELITIPGRNGVIVREDGAYDTYSQTYQIWFRNTMNRDTFQIARDVAEWLLSASGFCRLEDTYEPEYFRLARFNGPLNVETVLKNHGRATLEFDVQPQRYFKNGETPIEIVGDVTIINNPTQFVACPLYRIEDKGATTTPVTVTYTDHSVIDIDGTVETANYIPEQFVVSQMIDIPSGSEVLLKTAVNNVGAYAFYNASNSLVKYVNGPVRYSDFTRLETPTGATKIRVAGEYIIPEVKLSEIQNVRTASLTVNGVNVSVQLTSPVVWLDADLHDAYFDGGENANNVTSFTDTNSIYATFPMLNPGDNTVRINNSNFKLSIFPRWWTL